jgi:GNAT superfamily N-acetyltransferase
VPRVELHAFSPDFVPDAGRLLAARHRLHRQSAPLLSPRFESAEAAEREIAAAARADHASGAVATRGGVVVGYLIGAPKDASTWGPNVWVESAGHAVDESETRETLRDLYGLAAECWVDAGRTAHYAVVPSHDLELQEAWSRVGFGQQHLHAALPAVTRPAPPPEHVVVRRAMRSDIAALAALEIALPAHQGRSPVFSAGRRPTLEESVAEWEDDFDDPAYTTFVAERDGVVVGSAVGCSVEQSGSNTGLIRPDRAGFLGFAAVFPHARGMGVGRALGEAVLWWSSGAGYPAVVTDWRVTNLLSSRAWPALGFRSTFVRMHRVVGY